MYKIFTLAIAVSVLPLSQKITGVNFSANNNVEMPGYLFPYKNTITINPFERKKNQPRSEAKTGWQQHRKTSAKANTILSGKKNLKPTAHPTAKTIFVFFMMKKGLLQSQELRKSLLAVLILWLCPAK